MQAPVLSENTQATMSYAVGGLGYFSSIVATDVTTMAQVTTVVLAAVVVAIRVAHDTVRFYRYLKKKSDE